MMSNFEKSDSDAQSRICAQHTILIKSIHTSEVSTYSILAIMAKKILKKEKNLCKFERLVNAN